MLTLIFDRGEKMKNKNSFSLILKLFIIINLAPTLVLAEPKGVAHRVDFLTEQISELNNRFLSVQEENKRLNRMVSHLSSKVNELTDSNMQLSEKIICIDTLPSGDLLVIDCDVHIPSNETNYNSLFIEGGIETKAIQTEAIQDVSDSGLNIASDKSIQLNTHDMVVNSDSTIISSTDTTLIESAEQIVLKSGKSEIIMKKNGDITIKGKNIDIKASGDLTLKGSRIIEN